MGSAFFLHTEDPAQAVHLRMCNLYSVTKGHAAIIATARVMRDTTGNLPPMFGICLQADQRA